MGFDTLRHEGQRFLVPPAGATAGLSPRRRSPAVPRCFGSRVPTVPLSAVGSPLSCGQRPCSLATTRPRAGLFQTLQGGVLVAVQDESTARANMRAHVERLADALWTWRPVGQDAAAVLAGILWRHGHHWDLMQPTVVLHPASLARPAPSEIALARRRLRTRLRTCRSSRAIRSQELMSALAVLRAKSSRCRWSCSYPLPPVVSPSPVG